MPMDIRRVVNPASTALLTIELQRNRVGDLAKGPLAESAQRVLPEIERLVAAARRAEVPVAHCLKLARRDLLGQNTNVALYKLRGVVPDAPLPPDDRLQEGAELIPALGPDPRDLTFTRIHGMSAIFDGGVDPVLRTLRVENVIVVGISANVAIPNTVMDLVNRSYEVVVPQDAIAGTPAGYTDVMVGNTLKMLATVTTTQAIIDAWNAPI